MKKQTETLQPDQSPELRGKGRGLNWYLQLSLGGLVSLILCYWLISAWQFDALYTEKALGQAEAAANNVAGRLSQLNLIRQALLQQFSDDADLIALFAGDDAAALKQKEEAMLQAIPDAIQVRLLPVGMIQPDTSLTPPMSYATMEQLHRAEKVADVPPAEVHQFGKPHQHISLVVSVRPSPDESPIGLVQVVFPFKVFNQRMSELGQGSGFLEIRQLVPNATPLRLVGNGSARSEASDPPAGSLKISGSIWEVEFWPEPVTLLNHQATLSLILGGALLLIIGLLFVGLKVHLQRALKADQRSLLSLLDSALKVRLPKMYQAQLNDMQPVLDAFYHQIREVPVTVDRAASQQSPDLELGAVEVEQGQSDAVGSDNGMAAHKPVALSASIFRAYDIRGVVGKTVTPEIVRLLGQSIGSEFIEQGLQSLVVGRDGRESSQTMMTALIEGLRSAGSHVTDIGLVPTPTLYFAAHELTAGSGVMVTGSHNPREYNGLKLIKKGESLSPEEIQGLRRRIDSAQLLTGEGDYDSQDVMRDYIERILSDVRLARTMKVVIDCGNGAAGLVAPQLLRELGCEVVELFCEVDGRFPNHHPDPSRPENLQALQREVLAQQADIGLAFDGDADRLGVVDSKGDIIWPDRVLMYLAIDVLSREPGGDIIFDVKCTRNLANVILANGGRPVVWKTGHSQLKMKMKETNALLAGEFSGHIIFAERWYGFDDGLYTAARLLEILALDNRSSAEAFEELPNSLATPEYALPLPEGESERLMEKLSQLPPPADARILTIDGIRADFVHGWGLVRASNTVPALIFRFEANSHEGMEQVKGVFREMIAQVDPDLKLPF